MSIKEDAAVKLNEAYEAALITPHPVCRHGEFIDYVIDNTHLTFKYNSSCCRCISLALQRKKCIGRSPSGKPVRCIQPRNQ